MLAWYLATGQWASLEKTNFTGSWDPLYFWVTATACREVKRTCHFLESQVVSSGYLGQPGVRVLLGISMYNLPTALLPIQETLMSAFVSLPGPVSPAKTGELPK